jgi:hypothetical protein|eukprot:COSAG01_NODE_30957_length_606_cov_1.343195_1_plen_89_part_00
MAATQEQTLAAREQRVAEAEAGLTDIRRKNEAALDQRAAALAQQEQVWRHACLWIDISGRGGSSSGTSHPHCCALVGTGGGVGVIRCT